MNSTLSEDAMDAGNPGWHSDPPGYHLIEKLGKGGMGVVYQAQDLNTGKFVAIKFALGNTVPRFLREYRQLASLEHPFIVKVFSLDAQALPPYMVMEYLSGQTLTEYRNGFPAKRLPFQIGIAFLSQLTEALTYLHNKNILHRDLKPENLMAQGDQIKLMDFGLVRPAQVSGPLTQSGVFIGTAKYAAPEQFSDAATVTAQADLYALGVIMYEIFTGECPFKGIDTATLREQHLNMVPLSPAQIVPEIPNALNLLILSLLEKNPRNRPVSADAVQFTLNSLPTSGERLPSDGNIQKGQIIHQRYRIDLQLGQGGYGAVYKADDLVLGQPVAIKVNTDISANAVRHFQDEASLLGRLQHPNLPRPRAYFGGAGAQCIVMDFVPGRNLAEMLKAGPIPEANLLRWADQICAALTYLHSQTPPVIHRDIKPENIIISDNHTAWLLDFGIAKIDPADNAKEIMLVGTPGYAPPEQYTGKQIDSRADIYALGATLYHVLTGERPPENKLATPASKLNPAISTRVSRAIAQAMAPKPDQRPTSAKKFNDALHGRHPRQQTQAKKAIGCALGLAATFGMLLAFLGIIMFGGWEIFKASGGFIPTNTSTLTLAPMQRTPIIGKTKTPKAIQVSTRQKPTITTTAKNMPAATKTPIASPSQAITSTLTLQAAPVSMQATKTLVAVLPLMPSETFTKKPSFTPSNTSTITATITLSKTATSTLTSTKKTTYTQTLTPSMTSSSTPSEIPTITPTFAPSETPSITPTTTPSYTSSITPTITPSFTSITLTITVTQTKTLTPTATSTIPAPIIVNPVLAPLYGTCTGSSWYKIAGAGYGATDLYLTLNTNVPANSTNSAKWTPNFPLAGKWKVETFVAFHNQITWQCSPNTTIGYDTSDARYKVYLNGSVQPTVKIDQKPLNNQWAIIGTYSFSAGMGSYVVLTDLNGESQLTRTVSFNVLRFTYTGP